MLVIDLKLINLCCLIFVEPVFCLTIKLYRFRDVNLVVHV